MWGEEIDCNLTHATLHKDKIENWHKINAKICSEFLIMDGFVLLTPIIEILAEGNSDSTTICKLITGLIDIKTNA